MYDLYIAPMPLFSLLQPDVVQECISSNFLRVRKASLINYFFLARGNNIETKRKIIMRKEHSFSQNFHKMQSTGFAFAVICICSAIIMILVSVFTIAQKQQEHNFFIQPTPQMVVQEKSPSFSMRVNSKNVESLSTAGFPRPSCACSTFNESKSVPNTNSKLVGFFQTFEKDESLYKRVVAEQINHLESSGLMNMIQKLHLTYVGPRTTSFKIPTNGTNSEKIVVYKHTKGMEELSLKLLYDHCVRTPQDSVFYIHSKGTYHPHANNELLRRNLMKGVVSCLHEDALSSSDVCGWRATPIPYPRIAGNMWAARCSYVTRLRDPASYKQSMQRTSASKKNVCKPWTVGRGRESSQHWILSHPTAVVSDTLPPISAAQDQPVYTWGYKFVPDPASWVPRIETFPRGGLAAHWFLAGYKDLHCSRESYRIKEYVHQFGPGVMRNLPCSSMYCQWFPMAFLQLQQTYTSDHARDPVARYLADMRAVGQGVGGKK